MLEADPWYRQVRRPLFRRGRPAIAAPRTPLNVLGEKVAEAAREGVSLLYTYADKTLSCVDCNQQFSFTASDQQFYADRQFSEPRRCASCRAMPMLARGVPPARPYQYGNRRPHAPHQYGP